jgi:hypothetical protein
MTDLTQLITSLRAGTGPPADQPAAADALADKVRVKPWVWRYYAADDSCRWITPEGRELDGRLSLSDAKAAAQADDESRILAAPHPSAAPLTVADALAVPEVRALVDAAKEVAAILQAAVVSGAVRGGDSYRIGGVYLQTVSAALDAVNAALAAWEGRGNE